MGTSKNEGMSQIPSGQQLTGALARNIIKTRYDDLSPETREVTKKSILDTLGVMFPPTSLEKACAAIAEIVKEAGGKQESTIIGFGGKAPSWMAAFVNGSLCHSLDYDDIIDFPGKFAFHPTACTFPAALAIAEKIGGISGKDFLTAVALGSDLGIRLGSAPNGRVLQIYPWFPITTFGPFCATAASGKLLGLSEEKMINALGITLQRVFGITEAMTDPDSEIRAIRDGYTNKEGVLSAIMAWKGIAASKDAVEKLFKIFFKDDYDKQTLTSDLGREFRGVGVGLKPWPSSGATHGFIQATLEIIREHSVKVDQIEEIVLTVGKFGAEQLCEPIAVKRNPKVSIDAKLSLPFTVGLALAKGKVEIADFLPQNLGNPKVLEMAKKITYRLDPEFGVITPAVIEIKTRDGNSFSKRVERPYGQSQNPLSSEDIKAKFRDCARYAQKPLSTAIVEELIDKLLRLEEVKDMKEITDLLTGV